jgi:peroxiredoxin family protein
MESELETTLEAQVAALRSRLDALEETAPHDRLSMIVFSGDLDKALAACILATGAAAMGMEVMMFFTFWGTPLLRKPKGKAPAKDLLGSMFGAMLPKGAARAKLSKMHFGGLGTAMMQRLMKRKNVASLEQLLEIAAGMEVKICICELSMSLMGFAREEMIDYPNLQYCGVATFLESAKASKIQLFL